MYIIVFSSLYHSDAPDNSGREFVLGFLSQPNDIEPSPPDSNLQQDENYILITTTENNSIIIEIPFLNQKRQFAMNARQSMKLDVSANLRMSTGQKTENKGIFIKAEREISVYGLNRKYHSMDAYLALPLDCLGYEFYVITHVTGAATALVGVIATDDSTEINFYLRMTGSIFHEGLEYRNGDVLSIRLKRLQTFQLSHSRDLTGTRITSLRYFAVLSGADCTTISGHANACSHLVEFVPPVRSWGTNFTAVPLHSSAHALFRIITSVANTEITFNGSASITGVAAAGRSKRTLTRAGDYVDFEVASDVPIFLSSSQPSLLVQFYKGTSRTSSDVSDSPFMTLVPSVGQFSNAYTFPKMAKVGDFKQYINLAALDTKHLVLNGKLLKNTEWVPIQGSWYSTVNIKRPPEDAICKIVDNTLVQPFGAIAHAHWGGLSFGHPAGMRLELFGSKCVKSVGQPGDGRDNDCDGRIDEELPNRVDDDGDGMIDEGDFPMYSKQNCEAWKSDGYDDGYFYVDPGGNGIRYAFLVYCSQYDDVSLTTVHHDLEKGVTVGSQWTNTYTVRYRDAGVDQMRALVEQAEKCMYHFRFDCKVFGLDHVTWVSYDGKEVRNWNRSEQMCELGEYNFKLTYGFDE